MARLKFKNGFFQSCLVNYHLWCILMLSFPSIAGKEAIGMILGYIIDLMNKKRSKLNFIELFAIFLFKPQ